MVLSSEWTKNNLPPGFKCCSSFIDSTQNKFFEDSLKGTTQVSIQHIQQQDTITHLSSCQTNKLQKGLPLRHQLNAARIRSWKAPDTFLGKPKEWKFTVFLLRVFISTTVTSPFSGTCLKTTVFRFSPLISFISVTDPIRTTCKQELWQKLLRSII